MKQTYSLSKKTSEVFLGFGLTLASDVTVRKSVRSYNIDIRN